jgi:hypothetical protein
MATTSMFNTLTPEQRLIAQQLSFFQEFPKNIQVSFDFIYVKLNKMYIFFCTFD